MKPQNTTLAKVRLIWDLSGRINHDIITDFKLNQYQKDDVLGYSAVVSFGSQLGVLTVNHSLLLCTRVLNMFEKNESTYEPINSCLKGVEIEIIKGSGVFHRFDPKVGIFQNNDNIEDGICQFLRNYLIYAQNHTLSEGVPLRIKVWSLFAIRLFLNDILHPLVVNKIVRNVNRNYMEIQSKTIADSLGVYEAWDEYQAFHLQIESTKKIFNETIPFCRTRLEEITRILGLSKYPD